MQSCNHNNNNNNNNGRVYIKRSLWNRSRWIILPKKLLTVFYFSSTESRRRRLICLLLCNEYPYANHLGFIFRPPHPNGIFSTLICKSNWIFFKLIFLKRVTFSRRRRCNKLFSLFRGIWIEDWSCRCHKRHLFPYYSAIGWGVRMKRNLLLLDVCVWKGRGSCSTESPTKDGSHRFFFFFSISLLSPILSFFSTVPLHWIIARGYFIFSTIS